LKEIKIKKGKKRKKVIQNKREKVIQKGEKRNKILSYKIGKRDSALLVWPTQPRRLLGRKANILIPLKKN